jgi:hypothetical protein
MYMRIDRERKVRTGSSEASAAIAFPIANRARSNSGNAIFRGNFKPVEKNHTANRIAIRSYGAGSMKTTEPVAVRIPAAIARPVFETRPSSSLNRYMLVDELVIVLANGFLES